MIKLILMLMLPTVCWAQSNAELRIKHRQKRDAEFYERCEKDKSGCFRAVIQGEDTNMRLDEQIVALERIAAALEALSAIECGKSGRWCAKYLKEPKP